MIDIVHKNPNPLLSKYIRKISIFESKREIQYKQRLTPSAYTYFSYNREDIPTPIIGKEEIPLKQRLQIVGPKLRDDISVVYEGNLSQILVEFSATGFYYLFQGGISVQANIHLFHTESPDTRVPSGRS